MVEFEFVICTLIFIMFFLLPILRLPKVTRNIISVQYATQSKSFSEKKKIKGVRQKIEIPVEEDVNKLLNYVCGLNIYKDGEDIKLKPDSEYPEWLWNIRTEKLQLSDLSPDTKQYWRFVRKQALIRKNEMRKYKKPKN
ncbi:39S ribosomal protein L54, mitochondrial isoform X1 [Apis dorsata]|uniref:39S ribosomal protein L54, mitochondrial isoform X1 n=1 Tax=Apis dorsata TaxID=7462 RepID=UPI0003DF4B71|nr:39S ribosomal protein L54, mitochondrial isoform X1 [Apis dorsata]